MRRIIRSLILVAPLCGVATYIAISGTPVSAGDETQVMDPYDNEVFPRGLKYLFPPPVPILIWLVLVAKAARRISGLASAKE